jgi:hypothetical protein
MIVRTRAVVLSSLILATIAVGTPPSQEITATQFERLHEEIRPQPEAPYRFYGIAFELAGPHTDDLLPPFHLRENAGSPQGYFANGAR